MIRVNIRPSQLSNRPVHEPAATQVFAPEVELERMVSCCLLGEDQFYVDGKKTQERIFELAHLIDGSRVAAIAVGARTSLGLRHVPLWLLIALANRKDTSYSWVIQDAAKHILRTPRDAMDLVALYWQQGKKPLPWSFKRAVADGFARWSDFQLARYATLGRNGKVSVRLLDLLRLVHPKTERRELFRVIAKDTIEPPETWESLLPLAQSAEQKREVWVKLLEDGKLGALATVRNLRNMVDVLVPEELVRTQLALIRATDVWPWQVLAAAKVAPQYQPELESLMLRSSGRVPPIAGLTGVLVDVSGSMDMVLSQHGSMVRFEAAAGVAVILREACERSIVCSFSNDLVGVSNELHGIALATAIANSQSHGGTYLGPAVQRMVQQHPTLDRLIVLTDEQAQFGIPPVNRPLFIVNLASYQRGVEFAGEATRINGWSGNVVRFLAQQINGALVSFRDEDED